MSKSVLLMMVGLLVVALTTPAGSQVVDKCLSEASVSCSGMRFFICPSYDGKNISDACVGGLIEIWARDAAGTGIPNIPVTDYWINSCDPAQSLCLCIAPTVPVYADSPTNAAGYTTISGTICGGGCVLSGGLYVSVQGVVIYESTGCIVPTCLDIVIVSPDINGDCSVSLVDFWMFANSYNKSYGMTGYNDCCDFTGDGACTLSDFGYFGEHYLH